MRPSFTFISKNCPECGAEGATKGNDLCLICTVKAMERAPMTSATGRAAQAHHRRLIERKHKAAQR